jgi:WD40 repeat protein
MGFSPDGRRIIAWGARGNLRLWETETGQELLKLPINVGERDPPPTSFSSDGRYIHAGPMTWDAGADFSALTRE